MKKRLGHSTETMWKKDAESTTKGEKSLVTRYKGCKNPKMLTSGRVYNDTPSLTFQNTKRDSESISNTSYPVGTGDTSKLYTAQAWRRATDIFTDCTCAMAIWKGAATVRLTGANKWTNEWTVMRGVLNLYGLSRVLLLSSLHGVQFWRVKLAHCPVLLVSSSSGVEFGLCSISTV